VNAVNAGDLLETRGFLALLLICYMIYLTFCFAAVSFIVLPTLTVNLSEKGLFLASRIFGII